MHVQAFFERMPFADKLGIEVTEATDGYAEGRVEAGPDLSWRQGKTMIHGGVTFALTDAVGGAALMSLVDKPVPTIDMRIDYLEVGTGDLRAEAHVIRVGDDIGVVEVGAFAEDGVQTANARGVYKIR